MIYGCGSFGDGRDMTQDFIDKGSVAIGWDRNDAPAIYDLFRDIRTGDLIYLKAGAFGNLTVKGVGIVVDDTPFLYDNSYTAPNCVKVKWLWTGTYTVGKIDDKIPVRMCTLYREVNRDICILIVSLIVLGASKP